jgi:hypothetical protein
MESPIRQLERQIREVKREIASLGDVHPGNVSKQWNVCGYKDCRCRKSLEHRHGPYWQLSYTWGKKCCTRFVREEDLALIRQQTENYVRLRDLVRTLVDLSMELCRARIERRHSMPGSKPTKPAAPKRRRLAAS